jgi:hypothetical protein
MLNENLQCWVADLAAAPGASSAPLLVGPAWELSFEGGLDCLIELDEGRGLLHLGADLCRPEAPLKAAVLEQAMGLNLYTRATGGATLGFDADRQTVVLSLARDALGLDETAFLTVLMQFVETALELRQALLGGPQARTGRLEEPGPGSAFLRA